jgi:hypothetical protein
MTEGNKIGEELTDFFGRIYISADTWRSQNRTANETGAACLSVLSAARKRAAILLKPSSCRGTPWQATESISFRYHLDFNIYL